MINNIYEAIDKEDITFNAGWRIYAIKFTKGLKANGAPCFGVADFDKCIISLDPNVDEDTARHTLVHEIFHVFLETMGLGGHHESKEDWVENTNEYITESMSRGILMLRNLNPKLWNILFSY